MLELCIRDPRLKSTVEPFENGNFKKALQELNKILKKMPQLLPAKALKAVTLVKLGRHEEAIPLAEEVVVACPTDESTLSVILWYLHETGQAARASQYLKTALEKCDNREDILVYLFLNQAQQANFSAQQQTARQLSQLYSSRLYTYWVIVSTLMQAESDPVLGERMFLPLAEKMLSRDAEECKMETHIELQLLVGLLERLQKPSKALDLLKKSDLLSRLDKMDYQVDYTLDRLRLVASLDDWNQVVELASERLKKHPNEWNCWQSLIETAVKPDQWEVCGPRVTQLHQLISSTIKEHPSIRGPQLAGLDLLANAFRRNWHSYPESDAVGLLQIYVDSFATKPICALDLAYLVPLLLPSEQTRTQFLEKIVMQSEEEVTVPGNAAQIYRRLCAYQIARANRHSPKMQQLLSAYFTHVPERLIPPVANSTTEVPDRTSSLDLCPADGFLLLATSALVDAPSPLAQCSPSVRHFAQALLTAYWLDQLGLAHAPSNHHFRLRLCSLFSLYGLACPELAIPQAKGMEMKQLLFVSLGHTIVSPGPLLSLWAESAAAGAQQHPSDESPMLTFFKRIYVLSRTSVTEAEHCLVSAYRSRVYTRICEFTKFAERLKHADIFLLVRAELVHWQIAVVPDDFDVVLENISGANKELDWVPSRIDKIVDCRDFSVSQNFDPSLENPVTQEDSFAHLVCWIRLRMLTVSAICQCTQILMSSIKFSDRLLNESKMPEKPESDAKAVDALQQLKKDDEMLADLTQQTDASPFSTPSSLADLLADLVLTPQEILTQPTPLPRISLATLYLHGPYKTVLQCGVKLITGIYLLVKDGVDSFSEGEQTSAFCGLRNPFCKIPQLMKDGQPDWSLLPRPQSEDTSYLASGSEAQSPTSALLLLAVLYETLTLDCLFASMVRSILRPRSLHLQQANKRQRRKAAKSRKSKGASDSDHHNGPDDEADASHHLLESNSIRRLDQIGIEVISVVKSLSDAANNLSQVADAWLSWAQKCAPQEFLDISNTLCAEMFPDDLVSQFPVMKPHNVTPMFTQIANSYVHGFTRLVSGFREKSASLGRMLTELQVYDASEKLAACHLQEPKAC